METSWDTDGFTGHRQGLKRSWATICDIYQSIFCTCFIHTFCSRGLLEPILAYPGPTLDKSPTYRNANTKTPTPMANLEWAIYLTNMVLVCGRKPGWPYTGDTCKWCTERPKPRFKPRAFLLWGDSADHCTTVLPFLLYFPLNCHHAGNT